MHAQLDPEPHREAGHLSLSRETRAAFAQDVLRARIFVEKYARR